MLSKSALVIMSVHSSKTLTKTLTLTLLRWLEVRLVHSFCKHLIVRHHGDLARSSLLYCVLFFATGCTSAFTTFLLLIYLLEMILIFIIKSLTERNVKFPPCLFLLPRFLIAKEFLLSHLCASQSRHCCNVVLRMSVLRVRCHMRYWIFSVIPDLHVLEISTMGCSKPIKGHSRTLPEAL
jgi:hypothetical protein